MKMSTLAGLFGTPTKEQEEETQPYAWSPIVNTPAGAPPTASTHQLLAKRAKPSSPNIVTIPDSVDEGRSTPSTPMNEQTTQPLSDTSAGTVYIPGNVGELPLYSSVREQSQTDIPARATATSLRTQAAEAIALKLEYIHLIRELHSLVVCGALSQDQYQTQLDVILGQMLAL